MTRAIEKASSLLDIQEILKQASYFQNKASDPRSHIWVGASAGTGKTKVLTDRVLRLMLPAENHVATDPTRILCITFTKAAAAEMASRIQSILADWVSLDDTVLRDKIFALTQEDVSDDILKQARQLFARVVDEGARMKIMTIHGFCESVLKRFPIEAGLSPDFELIDERQSREMLEHVIDDLFSSKAQELNNEELNEAIEFLSTHLDENGFKDLMKRVISERSDFSRFIRDVGGLSESIKTVYQYNKFDNTFVSKEEIEDVFIQKCDWSRLNRCAELLCSGGKKEQDIGQKLLIACQNVKEGKSPFPILETVFLTTQYTRRAHPFAKKTQENFPDESLFFDDIADRFIDVLETLKRLRQAQATKALLVLGYVIIQGYEAQKKNNSYLDFDDLIMKTSALFSSSNQAAWVLYKLDGGIDHILIDEAQDTSPDQWAVIHAITQEFFSGESRYESFIKRTLFVVGDEKQSIYSFHKADPAKFQEMKQFFKEQISALEDELVVVPLNTSFRSTSAVLDSVDNVFSNVVNKQGVTLLNEEKIEHFVHRQGQAGCVEVWPLAIESDHKKEGWHFPVEIIKKQSHTQILADKIATEISLWIENKKILPSKNRPIKPSDVMILLQKRGGLMYPILRALKARNVPVSGLDRLTVSKEIIIQDLISLAKFCLLNEDDLSLAEFLKSPFISMSEDTLMSYALDRKKSLWAHLFKQDEEIVSYLKNLRIQATLMRPYEFFDYVLTHPCPCSEVSGFSAAKARMGEEIIDPLNEFLSMAIQFEQQHVPHIQNFIEWFEADEAEIKREAEGSGQDAVRIMTVHGSKGLQAPIVILADAARKAKKASSQAESIVWPVIGKNEKSYADIKMPLWRLKSKDEDQNFNAIKTHNNELSEQEYRRLFYVAMTRASDTLIVAGSVKREEKSESLTWYNMMLDSLPFEKKPFVEDCEKDVWQSTDKLIYETDQKTSCEVDKRDKDNQIISIDKTEMPLWLYRKTQKQAATIRPLTPSKLDEKEPVIISPLLRQKDKYEQEKRFLRGNILHALLQFLPEIMPSKRREVATKYIKAQWRDITDKACDMWVEEIEAVLNNPDFSDVFGPGSRAEVPVSGLLSGKQEFVLSGQIDRLVILQDRILIVDYKTNRPSPEKVKDVPSIYMKQMAIYKQALQAIYPNHEVKTALLWTDQTKLMILSETDLDRYGIQH